MMKAYLLLLVDEIDTYLDNDTSADLRNTRAVGSPPSSNRLTLPQRQSKPSYLTNLNYMLTTFVNAMPRTRAALRNVLSTYWSYSLKDLCLDTSLLVSNPSPGICAFATNCSFKEALGVPSQELNFKASKWEIVKATNEIQSRSLLNLRIFARCEVTTSDCTEYNVLTSF